MAPGKGQRGAACLLASVAFALATVLLLTGSAFAADAGVTVQDRTVSSARHRITLAPTGLPEQVFIAPAVEDLPLELRGEGAEVRDVDLIPLGRGPRLSGPMRIVCESGGKVTEATAPSPAPVEVADGRARCATALSALPCSVSVELTYSPDGELTFAIASDISSGAPAALHLEVPLAGLVNAAYTGLPADVKLAEIDPAALDCMLPTEEGVVWSSGDRLPGRLFVGSPDAGFAWSALRAGEWTTSAEAPALALVRDKLQRVTLRIALRDAGNKGKQARTFTLRVLPVRDRPRGHRRIQWTDWAEAASERTPNGKPSPTPGWVFEGQEKDLRELTGAECADVVSAEKDHVLLYPNSLMQMLTAPCAGLAVRVRSNVRSVNPGDAPRFDRQILGRSLLHDGGAAIEGLSQPIEYLRLVRALREFGFFADEGTECIPYWRSESVVRLGEEFDASGEFNLATQNPAAGTFVTVFRRRFEQDGRAGVRALFVIMNQADTPVRARLYVLEPARVFGGELCTMRGNDMLNTLDFGAIPPEADWRKEKVANWPSRFREHGLMDLEDHGFVIESSNKGQTARIYGPVYVPAHDFRVLYGHWLPGDEKKRW